VAGEVRAAGVGRSDSDSALRGRGGPGRWSEMARGGAELGRGGPGRSGDTLRQPSDGRRRVEPGGGGRATR
jgi:hypothetical protein